MHLFKMDQDGRPNWDKEGYGVVVQNEPEVQANKGQSGCGVLVQNEPRWQAK